MLAITGAAGQVGGRVARRLAALGVKQRLIVREPAKISRLPGADIAGASSYGHAVEMGRALKGVKTLFLVSARDKMGVAHNAAAATGSTVAYNREQQQISAVDAAAAVGVRHIVYLSFLNAAPDATFVLARDHFNTEAHIRSLGIDFTFLRMSLFADHVPVNISADGVFRAPAGEGRAAWVTKDDLADVAVAVLTGRGHAGKTYDVTGPEALTMDQTALCLATATRRPISYQRMTPPQARATRASSGLDRFEAQRRAATGSGVTDYEVEVWVSHFSQIATGELDTVSDTVPRLTGRPAQSLADFLEAHPESYRHLLSP
jgi:NAD(P)H dehydrogenase (quinone)